MAEVAIENLRNGWGWFHRIRGHSQGTGDNAITVEFKPFGVSLGFTPTVLGNNVISMIIEPEVSSIDPSASVTTSGGTVVPGLQTRRASTTVELRDGQSFAIAGLLQTNNSKTLSQLPWIGDVPVLGALFRSASYQRNDTDLVIIVTPRLVRPASAPSRARSNTRSVCSAVSPGA